MAPHTQDAPSRTSLWIVGAAVALALRGAVVAVLGLFRPLRDDLAWANDEDFGTARLCTSTLARLGAG